MIKKVPNTFVIVFAIILLAAVMTWILPGGKYIEVNQNGHKELVFQKLDNQAQTWQIFSAFYKGFVRQAGIIVFILLIGGAFWVMNNSRAIDVGIHSFLKFTKKIEHFRMLRFIGVNNIIIILIMLMFSVFGAVFGMSEETIAFIIILVPLAISMGYDSITGVSMVFVAAGLGFAGAILNPFTIGIAQGIAELPLFSGIEYRLICWVIINVVGITYILFYARSIKKTPEKSSVYTEDEYWRNHNVNNLDSIKYYTPKIAWGIYIGILVAEIIFSILYPTSVLKIGNSGYKVITLPVITVLFAFFGFFSLRRSVHFFLLTILSFTIIFLIVGVMGYDWYIMEIATLFFVMGLLSGIAMKKSGDEIVKLFLEGVKDILPAALIVGLAGGIIIILEDGQIVDTVLYYSSTLMKDIGKVGAVSIMYGIQTLINIIIPSGSAKAALTMPIMAPFSDLINISRQATVMAFQFGDGFTNMITPTSAVLIGVLGIARIPYQKWVKWITPLILILIFLGFLLLIPTVLIPLNGF
ncbi:MAG: YfcC family protein [Bacteroidales bacterium]|nr:YfcC family protein [Bacteroidales bacterium]